MKNILLTFLIINTFFWSLSAQEGTTSTIGLTHYSEAAAEGYTLFATMGDTTVYLIDNCGYKIHEWETQAMPGAETKLLADGRLLRAERVRGSGFAVGGSGGRLSLYDWDSNVLWSYVYSEVNTYQQHHDVEMMPNGNILLLAWEYHSKDEAIAIGRFPSLVTDEGLWSEKVVEIQPIGTDSAAVVWEWRLWDHLVQDFDDNLDNFGEILDNPQKVDVNTSDNSEDPSNPDWVHANGLSYNAELDQILITSKHFSEFWIIDHSITTAEAATEQGDLLFRFGNPVMTQSDHLAEQVLSHPHNAHWIPTHLPYGGNIIVFNNGHNQEFSEVYILDGMSSSGDYNWDNYLEMGAEQILWRYPSSGQEDTIFSPFLSGADVLENGNVLICHGPDGLIREVDEGANTVWEYINPVSQSGIATQGSSNSGNLFRAYRYPLDYPAFTAVVFEPIERIELEPLEDDCDAPFLSSTVTNTEHTTPLKLYKTPGQLQLEGETNQYDIILYNQQGQTIRNWKIAALPSSIDLPDILAGFYYVAVQNRKNMQVNTFKIIETK